MAKGILKYKMVTRINPQNKSEQPKWYAKANINLIHQPALFRFFLPTVV